MHYRLLFDNNYILKLLGSNLPLSTFNQYREIQVKEGIISIAGTWSTKDLALSVGIPYIVLVPDEVKRIKAYMALGANTWEAMNIVIPVDINNAIAVIHEHSQRAKHETYYPNS